MARVFVSVGSNLEREQSVRAAIAALRRRFGALEISPVFECPAEGFAGAPFYNLVVAFETGLPPGAVLDALHAIEDAAGRDRSAPRFSDRALDLDLLTYGDLVCREPGLRLPREDITRYAFVLAPLAALAPGERHPESDLSYAELWARFSGESCLTPVELDL